MTDPKLWLQLNLNPQVQVVTKNIPNGTIYYRPDRDKWIDEWSTRSRSCNA